MNHNISFSQGLHVALTSAIWAHLGASQLSLSLHSSFSGLATFRNQFFLPLLSIPLAHAPATNCLLSESPTWLFTCCFAIFFPDCD